MNKNDSSENNLCNKVEDNESREEKINQVGLAIKSWLYSDPAYAHRLMNEGSSNW